LNQEMLSSRHNSDLKFPKQLYHSRLSVKMFLFTSVFSRSNTFLLFYSELGNFVSPISVFSRRPVRINASRINVINTITNIMIKLRKNNIHKKWMLYH